MPPLLTICIPTYKRPELLKKCLESIFAQADPQRVRVVVFDDSVSDINADVANWAAARFAAFRFIKNPVNLGIDRNIEECLNVATEGYVLVLGEDDILMDGAMAAIDACLAGGDVDMVFTNYVYVNNSLDKVIRRPFNLSGRLAPQQFIEQTLWAIGFIGGTIFSARLMAGSTERFLGTYFNHVGRLASAIGPSTVIVAAPMALVGNRSEDISSATWSSSYYDVLFGYEALMDTLAQRSAYGASFVAAKESFRAAMQYRSIGRVAVMRSYGVYGPAAFRAFFGGGGALRQAAFWLIAVLPPAVFVPGRLVFNALRFVKRLTYPV